MKTARTTPKNTSTASAWCSRIGIQTTGKYKRAPDPLDDESQPISATGVFRPSNGPIYLKSENSTGYADAELVHSIPGDIPVAGDWGGDRIDTIGVYREGAFRLRNINETGYAETYFALGVNSNVPISGKWGLP